MTGVRRALISGGGIGGLTAALALARAGIEVDLVEQASEFREIGAGIQLSPNCVRVLEYLGLGAALRAVAFVPQRTDMRHWQRGEIVASTPLGAQVVERFGFAYYHVHRADLIDALARAAAATSGIRLHVGEQTRELHDDSTGVQLHTQSRTLRGDVLIGADGIRSRVRTHLFGDASPRFTGNVAWRALVPVERLPKDFVAPATSVWMGPGKHFVHYYVRGGALVNCVCVVEKQGWEVESWSEQGNHDELRADFADWHEGVTRLIAAMDRDACFKWALFDREPMSSWSRGRITLLGDACHPTLPFMAQGAAMAIEDAAVLAGCLRNATTVDAALLRYESLRRARTAGVQTGSRRNAQLFHLRGEAAEQRDRNLATRPGTPPVELYEYDALGAADGGV